MDERPLFPLYDKTAKPHPTKTFANKIKKARGD